MKWQHSFTKLVIPYLASEAFDRHRKNKKEGLKEYIYAEYSRNFDDLKYKEYGDYKRELSS